jgi:hypothetical protein
MADSNFEFKNYCFDCRIERQLPGYCPDCVEQAKQHGYIFVRNYTLNGSFPSKSTPAIEQMCNESEIATAQTARNQFF